MFVFFILVVLIIVIVIFKMNSGKSSNYSGSSSSGRSYTPASSSTEKRQRYAKVYPYGFWSACTYTCEALYDDGDLVVVDIKGQLYPGRIVEISNQWPDDVPQNITLKPIIRRLKPSDKGKLTYWSEQIDGFFR